MVRDSCGCCDGFFDDFPVIRCQSVSKTVNICGLQDPETEIYNKTVTKSGDNRHTEVTTYTYNSETDVCSVVTTCSGSDRTGTRVEFNQPEVSVTVDSGVCVQTTVASQSGWVEITEDTIYSEDCTTTIECAGTSEFRSSTVVTYVPNPPFTASCAYLNYSATGFCTSTYGPVATSQPPIDGVPQPDLMVCLWNGSSTATDSQLDPPTVVTPIVNNPTACFIPGDPPGEDDAYTQTTTLIAPGPVEVELVVSDIPTVTLPAFDDGAVWNVCNPVVASHSGAYNTTTCQKLAVSRTKSRYRIEHAPTKTCYLKVWLTKTTRIFTQACTGIASDSATVEILTYEWTGTGNPCFSEALKRPDHADNRIISDVTDLPSPTAESRIEIAIQKYSYVVDYEPDITDPDNRQPSGFPDPTWEASPP